MKCTNSATMESPITSKTAVNTPTTFRPTTFCRRKHAFNRAELILTVVVLIHPVCFLR